MTFHNTHTALKAHPWVLAFSGPYGLGCLRPPQHEPTKPEGQQQIAPVVTPTALTKQQ